MQRPQLYVEDISRAAYKTIHDRKKKKKKKESSTMPIFDIKAKIRKSENI